MKISFLCHEYYFVCHLLKCNTDFNCKYCHKNFENSIKFEKHLSQGHWKKYGILIKVSFKKYMKIISKIFGKEISKEFLKTVKREANANKTFSSLPFATNSVDTTKIKLAKSSNKNKRKNNPKIKKQIVVEGQEKNEMMTENSQLPSLSTKSETHLLLTKEKDKEKRITNKLQSETSFLFESTSSRNIPSIPCKKICVSLKKKTYDKKL